MDLIQIVVLAIVQGLTEFLPISSSAHLILVPLLSGWQDQSLSFDIAVHVGTLTAVMIYFRRELGLMLHDAYGSVVQGRHTPHSRLAWGVIWGTVPLGLAGIAFKPLVETQLRSPLVIAAATLFFGLLLWYAACNNKAQREETAISWWDVFIIGCAQVLALIPGTSRSGITLTAGLLRGLTPQASARFSFLLSIPAIGAAGLLQTMELLGQEYQIDWLSLLLGAALSALSALMCIHFFLKALARIGMLPFVLYRLLLGAVLLFLFW